MPWQRYNLIESITKHLLGTSPVSFYTGHEPYFMSSCCILSISLKGSVLSIFWNCLMEKCFQAYVNLYLIKKVSFQGIGLYYNHTYHKIIWLEIHSFFEINNAKFDRVWADEVIVIIKKKLLFAWGLLIKMKISERRLLVSCLLNEWLGYILLKQLSHFKKLGLELNNISGRRHDRVSNKVSSLLEFREQ